jgi:lipopolysaccharide biosynthesis glycosyltransferase
MTKSIIVTAADQAYAPLLLELLESLGPHDGMYDAIGVLDVGLSQETVQVIQPRVTSIVVPEWDLPVEHSLRESHPHLRATLARPFLRNYFPGFELYLWLDADTWVQDRYALEWYIAAAQNGSLGIAPQIDRSYRHPPSSWKWRKKRLLSYYGASATKLLYTQVYYNAGAFSLSVDAPHWDTWAKYFKIGLHASPQIVTDQTALNFAIWNDSLGVHPLPALCNWCCHLAIPSFDHSNKKLCEPHLPYRPIGLIHLTAHTKDIKLKATLNGNEVGGSLRYKGFF